MSHGASPPWADANEEVAALIEVLHETGQRLEELTKGEVDSVADRHGRSFLLRRAQDRLRVSEAAKKAAILNALPAYIALLDTRGLIISVNEAWSHFGSATAIHGPGHDIGLNYLDICDGAWGDGSSQAHQVAEGIRSVLDGAAKSFSIEYPCHSPMGQRWFLLTATPLSDAHPNGAVVMHMDVTTERESEERLRVSEGRFRQMAETIRDVFFLRNLDSSHMYYVSPAYQEIWGRTCESLYESPGSWADAIHPEDLARALKSSRGGGIAGSDYEFRIVRPDGETRWIRVRGFPILDDAGNPYRTAGIASDITERKQAADELRRSESLKGAILDASLDCIVTIDDDGKIVEFNAAAEVAFGFTSEQALGKAMVNLIVPLRMRDAHRRGFEHYRATGEGPILGKRLELEALRADGTEFPIELAITSIGGMPKPMFTAFIRDITVQRQAAQDLHESERRFSDMLANLQMVSVMLDREGRITYCNEYFLRLTGWNLEEVIGGDWFERFMSPELGDMKSVFSALITDVPETWHRENDLYTRSGERRLIRWSNSVLRSGNGDVIGTASIGEDITEQRAAELRVKRLNRIYAVLSEINALIVRARDRDELFRDACRIAVEAGAFKMAWVGVIDPHTLEGTVVASCGSDDGYLVNIKLTAREGMPGSERPACRALRTLQPVICNDIATDSAATAFRTENLARGHKSGGCFPLTVAGLPAAVIALFAGETNAFDAEETRLFVELAGNISFALDHLDKVERINYLAYYDSLTGLANRALFHERLERSMRDASEEGSKLALVLLDVERFRTINDTFGRQAGDVLLKDLAERMTVYAADVGRLARVDANHFAVMVPNVQSEEDLARRIELGVGKIFGSPFRMGESELRVCAKFGFAVFPGDGADPDTLFRNAEAALKNAKTSGDRYLFYNQAMNELVAEKLTLENKLREAIERGQFVLHYQPKVSLASGKVTSAEALIRWNDPQTGLVPPGKFIPILEETGLIHEVGRWALREAVREHLRWRGAGLDAVRIAVNVSALQLRSHGFIAEVEQAIGIDAHAAAGLELEITESLIMADLSHSIASLQAIRAMGVTIAIDDFGTGFSSLSHLAKLPVDTLKIDRSFVVDMAAGPQGLAVVSTIIDLAHALKLKVVAEGVETEEQSRLLRLLSCDEMQGYLFCPPVPCEIFQAKYLSLSAAA